MQRTRDAVFRIYLRIKLLELGRAHLVDHAVEDVDGSIVGGRRKQGVAPVECHTSQCLLVISQSPVRFGGQVQIKPGQPVVLQNTRAESASYMFLGCKTR